jgi:O-antigen/teichoic acid export membrane protein
MHAVGQLTIAVSVGGILSIPIQGFLRSLAPWIMSQMTLNTRGGLTNVVRTNVFVHLFGFAAGLVALLVLQHVFFWIVDKKFAPALAMMPWILMTQYATLSFGSAFPILLFERKTMSIGIISLVASAAGVAATFLLVPYFDADGAAMGIAVGYVTRAVIVSYIAHSILAMHRATPVESR